MSLIVLGFLTILAVTFFLVIMMTRRAPIDVAIDRRMASIQRSPNHAIAAYHEASQFFKASNSGSFAWLGEMLDHRGHPGHGESWLVPRGLRGYLAAGRDGSD
jgi:hypothetical protein